jgi:mRNA degradation ribonuclease J1/J2
MSKRTQVFDPRQDMLGIDLVIPDITYLTNNRERVRAYLFTHGHEDHIGAVPYVFPRVPAPVYGTKLTCALIRGKLTEHNISGIHLNVIKPKDTVQIGSFSVQFIKVSHSIAGAVAMAITCPAGTVIITGDFKIDYTPIDGEVTDRFPTTPLLAKARPVWKRLPGWKCDIRGIRRYEDLPENCRRYIEFIEEQLQVPITMVSNGPGRDDIIYR